MADPQGVWLGPVQGNHPTLDARRFVLFATFPMLEQGIGFPAAPWLGFGLLPPASCLLCLCLPEEPR
ncbi:hypothetical protein [Tautonia rosea]|uniref:hypothetical protein n=1 Tax=Tautonia rosea TaxID=2728037 RepID=UPI0014765F1D|nr:hypothetical protein [Tautonia rosea]